MSIKNILQWKLFRDGLCSNDLKDFSGIHFCRKGESAFFIKRNKVYPYSFTTNNAAVPSSTNVFGTTTTTHAFKRGFETFNLDLNGIKAISTGLDHAVILDTDGCIYCFGCNESGQLGAGHCGVINQPYKTNLKAVDQISCGKTFTIALSKCDEIWFWGTILFTNSRQHGKCFATPTLIELPADPVPKTISAGAQHVAITCENKKIYTWGSNEEGELGHGHQNIISQPQLVTFEVEFVLAVCACHRTIFITEEGALYICDNSTNNLIQCISETINIQSLATHWSHKSFIAVDECGFFYGAHRIDDRIIMHRKALEDVLDGFIDVGTPSVYWSPNSRVANKTYAGITLIDRAPSPSECSSHVDVADLYNSEIFSDIQIKLSDGNIHAHKVILSLKSANLKKAITVTDSVMKVLDMSNMNSYAYRMYIKYLYTGSLGDIETLNDIPDVYFMGEEDENEELKTTCLKIWKDGIKKENIIRAFEKAYLLKLQVLLDACGPILNQNLQYILNAEEYNLLPVGVKLSLLTIAATRHSN